MDGLLVLRKEKGYTSHDTVSRLRGILSMRRIGHLGTLDPDAEGVLPVLLGRGTRLAQYLPDEEKVYTAGLLLGVRTDTQDVFGTMLSQESVHCSEEAVREAIMRFSGKFLQLTPMYSARKIDGKKLVDLARSGQEAERPEVPVEISRLDILSMDLPRVTIRVRCSKGTYIRTLCHDIGELLGCGGVMESLVREEACGFSLSQAHTLSELQIAALLGRLEEYVIPLKTVFSAYPAFTAAPAAEGALRNGNPVRKDQGTFSGCPSADGPAVWTGKAPEGLVRMFLPDGTFCGLYRSEDGSDFLKAERLLAPEEEDREDGPFPAKRSEAPALLHSQPPAPASVVSLGKFDGFHRGHQKLLQCLTQLAAEKKERPVLFSFTIPGQPSLETQREKRESARALGVKVLMDCPFTEEIRTMEAEVFLQEILLRRLGMTHLVVGPDCRFGYRRRGDLDLLREMAPVLGFGLTVVEKLRYEGEVISSTRIREALTEGRMETVTGCLGHPYTVRGKAEYGKQRGRELGFPTVNLSFPAEKLTPPYGVYAARLILPDGSARNGMANLGVCPTFGDAARVVLETHLFDFDEVLYGRPVAAELCHFMRGEQRFDSAEALREQMRRDEETVREFFRQ